MSGKIKVLITYRDLSEKYVEQIRKVSEKITAEVSVEEENVLKSVEDAEIIFGGFNKEMFSASKKLRWVHVPSAGVDRYLFPEFVDSSVMLTTSSGVHRTPISELAIAMMLTFAKQLHRFVRLQLERKWDRLDTDELAGKTIGILGLGNVGMATAWKAKCFGMRVLALEKRTVRRPSYVDEVLGPEDLDRFLQESDYLVIIVPLTRETYHMIGERELRLMKPSVYIINMARGAVIDNQALVKALKEEWIAGAGLDVFEEEPLPQESELWQLDNVLITPHIAGWTPHYQERATEIFCRNLARYLDGKPLINLVDKKIGY